MTRAGRLEGPRAPLFYSAAALLLLSAKMTTAQTVELSALELCAGLEKQELKLACFEAIIAAARTPAAQVPEAAAVVAPENEPAPIEPEVAAPDQGEKKGIIKAMVVDVTQGSSKLLYFHLANGHVWRQIEPRRLQYPKSGNFEVSISQGVMGAYRLRIGDNGRLVSIRRVH